MVDAQQAQALIMLPASLGNDPSGHRPFEEGVRARVRGRSWADCPYPPGSYRRTDWLNGWDEEDALTGSWPTRARSRR